MKLSEAVLKGCEGTKKEIGGFLSRDGETFNVCFFGAAAIGYLGKEAPAGELIGKAGKLQREFNHLPREWKGFSAVRLNDIANWSRESIAALYAERGY